jgi:hypothetical protein
MRACMMMRAIQDQHAAGGRVTLAVLSLVAAATSTAVIGERSRRCISPFHHPVQTRVQELLMVMATAPRTLRTYWEKQVPHEPMS